MKTAQSFFSLGINRNQKEYALQNILVIGKIPDWLKGNYIRNGPGMFTLDKK